MALMTRSASLLSALLLLAFASSWSADGSVLQDYCGRTFAPQPCVDYLSRLPESSTTDDPHHLAELGIRVVADVGTNASSFIDHILDTTATNDSAWQPVLHDCSQNYIDAVDQVDDCTFAMDHLDVAGGYADVNRLMDAAATVVGTCHDACKGTEAFPEKEKLLKMNQDFMDVCKIVLALVNLVRK